MINQVDLLFSTISGSNAYGLATPTSDVDVRGIFLKSNKDMLLSRAGEQHNDATNDITYYELNRALQLLAQNNPNMLEMLYIDPQFHIVYDDRIKPLMERRDIFLTKQIRHSFGGYAVSQIQKARGLNKKIVNPMSEELKPLEDFCTIIPADSLEVCKLSDWLAKEKLSPRFIGLSKIDQGTQLYRAYYDYVGDMEVDNPKFKNLLPEAFKGINRESGGLQCSVIPKKLPSMGIITFNINGYESYLREYKNYHDWVKKRNPHRYNDNINNKHNYDGKNMMHSIRLLTTAIKACETGELIPLVDNRDYLLSIRNGQIPYEDVLKKANDLVAELDEAVEKSSLPSSVDQSDVESIIIKIRDL